MEPLLPLPLEALPPLPPLALAVVGHVEMVSFIGVPHLPAAGEILHAEDFCELPAGGGAVVAVQMARLTGQRIPFFTALGNDDLGHRAAAELDALGLELHIAWREAPTRRGITFIDAGGERTITVIGERLMEILRHLDPVAYVRFASVYREFKDARDFVDELEPILNDPVRDASV
jgi:ribokinase